MLKNRVICSFVTNLNSRNHSKNAKIMREKKSMKVTFMFILFLKDFMKYFMKTKVIEGYKNHIFETQINYFTTIYTTNYDNHVIFCSSIIKLFVNCNFALLSFTSWLLLIWYCTNCINQTQLCKEIS